MRGREGESWYERLTALDAAFLNIEAPTAPMHVGSVSLFQGRPPGQRELATLIASRLDRVPRYAQKLATVPFGIGRPVWVDDPAFDLDKHVLRRALPRPGGMTELAKLVGRLFARPLDRSKPLWEYWIVEGLSRRRFAVVSKTHHCMIDGVSGVDLAAILMETEKGAKVPDVCKVSKVPFSWKSRPAPGPVSLPSRGRGPRS